MDTVARLFGWSAPCLKDCCSLVHLQQNLVSDDAGLHEIEMMKEAATEFRSLQLFLKTLYNSLNVDLREVHRISDYLEYVDVSLDRLKLHRKLSWCDQMVDRGNGG
jgi:hypothetical protein